MNFDTLVSRAIYDLGYDLGDEEAVVRVKAWINEIVGAHICREKGIKGLNLMLDVVFIPGEEKKEVLLGDAFNARSKLLSIAKAYLVYGGTNYPLYPIDFEDSLDYKVYGSQENGRPTFFCLHGFSGDQNPYLYLYPVPDADCTVKLLGVASIGELEANNDVVYPVGSEFVIIAGVRWKFYDFEQDVVMAESKKRDFLTMLRAYKVADMGERIYVIGRKTGVVSPEHFPPYKTPIVGP